MKYRVAYELDSDLAEQVVLEYAQRADSLHDLAPTMISCDKLQAAVGNLPTLSSIAAKPCKEGGHVFTVFDFLRPGEVVMCERGCGQRLRKSYSSRLQYLVGN